MNKLTIEQAAYIAGFIDTDGCINSHYIDFSGNYKNGNVRCSISMAQAKQGARVIYKIQSWIGCGHITIRERQSPEQDLVLFSLTKQEDISALIIQIKRYLIVKKKQAELVLKILDAKKIHIEATTSHLKIQKDYHDFIKLLNSPRKNSSLLFKSHPRGTSLIARKAYLAGFIDGDGCINMSIAKKPKRYIPIIQIIIAQDTRRRHGLEIIRKLIGDGKIYESSKSTSYLRIMKRAHTKKLLKDILPYLIIKREQALVALEVIELQDSLQGYSKSDYSKFLNYKEILRDLKRK